MSRSAAALYVSFPNGQPYTRAAFDSDEQAFGALANLAANTETDAVPCRMQQHRLPYSDMLVPVWEFDMVLRTSSHPGRMVLHAAIRMEPVPPTLKPGDHHEPRNYPPAGR